ncbi:MAG: hypothetical protein HDT47_00215 [Ruminococcaceae bacterium]|nr:hypothetical protein [Oscillospiraceae bacterium]
MKTFIRKITALLIALTTSVSMFGNNTYAYEAEKNDLVQIGEYECYVIEGQYYTEIDGETYLVINLDENVTEDDGSNISFYTTNWQNGRVVDISDGSTYSDTMNASQADDCTPIIQGNPSNGYKITIASLPWYNQYEVNVHYFCSAYNQWHSEVRTLKFFMEFATSNILFAGSTAQLITKICVEFYHDGSTGKFPFTYTIQQC